MGFITDVIAVAQRLGVCISFTKHFEWTGYNKKEDSMTTSEVDHLIKLMDAICVAWDNPDYYPEFENGVLKVTHCNQFVNDVAKAVGCNDFFDPVTHDPLMADDIIRVVSGSSRWAELRVAGLPQAELPAALWRVQVWANQGYLTLAGASGSALGAIHGHVCIIRPGKMRVSGKWGEVPAVANVGKENFIGRAKTGPMKGEPVGINQAFIQLPHFWSWKGN